jgi:adenosylhomocysteine nucleosidase
MELRRATPDDAEAILEFWNDAGASASVGADVGHVRRVTEHPAAVLLLALIDGAIIGSLLGTFDGWRGNLYRLVVAPAHRRRGLGRRLVREMEDIFQLWGVQRSTALVEIDRPWATQFWSAVGYPRDERIVRHVGTHSDAVGGTDHGLSSVPSRHRVVVLISANAEWTPAKEALKPVQLEQSPYGEYFTHRVSGEPVLFLHGGWGKIAAAASTDYAIGRWHPDVLINLGTCGGIEGRTQRGEKLLVTRAVTYDIHEAMGDSAAAIQTYTTDIDLSWLDRLLPIPLRYVSMISADRDLVPSETPDLVRRFDAVAADWESSAIAYVANKRNVRLLIVRAVSDLVDTHRGEAIGALALFQNEAAKIMRSLLADLDVLVPHVLGRGSVSS